MNEFKQITTIDELKAIFKDNDCCSQFFVQLSGGFRSWKEIFYNDYLDEVYIKHEIDETEETFSMSDFLNSYFYKEYMQGGALYYAWT